MRARVPLASGFLALTLFVACGDDKKGDHTAPVVTIDAPAAGAVVGASVHVSGTVVDPQGKGEVKPSGVVAVTVHGVAATLSDGAFAADLSDLPAGALSIDVAATDAKGNVGTAQVAVTVSPAVALIVDPFTVRLEASGQTQAISVKAMAADGAQRPIAAADLTFDMLDASVASVGADGVVTAVADGITKLRVQGAGAEAQVTIAVVLDSEPPGEPSILSYLPETNGASEGWIGRTEPYAKVVIQGAATPVAKVADERGHFYADVPLTAGRMNDVAVVLTDVNGNVSRAYPFPIRQNAAAIDRGMLHVSFGRAEVAFGAELEGIAGEVLPHPMMARATDNDGRPLTNTEVEFTITSGAGSLSTVGPTEAVPGGVARAMATTDSEGYARVWWRLSPSALDENELLARLPGDLGVPILWQATGLFASSGHATIAGRVEDEFGLGEKDLLVQLTTGGTPTRTDELGEFLLDVPDDVFTSPNGAIAGSSGRVVTVLLNADASGGGAQVTRNTYPLTVFPGRENRPLGAFNLPRLPVGTALQLDASGHVTEAVTLSSQITGQQLPTKLHVPVGTLVTFPEGLPAERRRLAIIQVPINATPMPMPDGYFTSYIIGVQPGGTTFDPPLPIEIPNVDDYPPGSEVDLRAWDHTLARYVDSGRGTVSEDAGYILSDPGAGIRMGAWHGATRKPDDPCYVTYTVTDPGVAATADQHEEVDLPKDDEQDCVCKINGVASACELDKKGDPGRPPRSQTIRAPCNNNNFPGPRPPDPKKPDEPLPAISVECKPKKKGIKITYPAKTKEPYSVRIGTEVPFHAQCEDGKSDGSIQWQAAGGTATNLSGPSIKVKFEKKGKFTVSASGTTKTCKGSDTRVIEVLDCVDAGQVRVCGDKITDLGGGKYTVGPSATIGVVKPTATDDLNPVPVDPDHAGQFLRCNAVVNVAPDKVSASCALSMDIGLAAITSRVLNDVIIYQGAFEISGDRNIKLTIANYEGPQKGFQYDIAGLPLALTNTPVVLMPDGIGIDTPDLQFFKPKETVVGSFNSGYDIKECGKVPITDTDGEKMYVPGCDIAGVTEKKVLAPDQITAALTGLFLSPTRTSVSASFSWTREIEFKIGALTKIAFSYDAAPDKYAGAIGFAFGPPVKRVGIEVAGELTKGKVTSASITATFSKRLGDARFPLSLPGIPLPPSGVGPFFLSSINATVTNPCYLFDACPGLYPTFATTAAITLAPTVKIAGQEYALWSGTLTGTFASFPMKIELSGKASLLGTVTGFAASATPGDPAVQVAQKAVKGLGVLDGAVGLELSGGDDFKVYLKGGLTINNPFGDPAALGPLAEARIDTSITRVGNNFKGNASLSGALYVPKFKIFGVAFGGTKYAGGTAIMRTQSLPGTATDPAGEVSGDVILGTGVFGDSNFHIDMSFEKGVFAWINNKYAGFVPIGYVAGMLGSYQVTPPSAPSIALDATSGEQVFEYDGTNPDIELGVPAENLWLQIEHVGPATFDLQLPDGSVVTHDAVVADPGEARAFYLEGAGLEGQTQRTTWSVPMAAAGAYHVLVVDHPENVRRVLARVAPKPPSFVFDEPVTVADGAADIAWNATDDGAFSAELFYSPVDGGGDLIPITTIADPTATDHYSWSLTGVRPGTYAIVARVSDDDAPATLVRSRSTVRVDGAGGALPAPRLVREQAGVVSWLPVAGATSYLVHAEPLYRTPPFLAGLAGAGSPFTLPGAASSDTLELCRGGDLQLSAPTTRAAIPGFVSGCVFDVTIGVQDADGLAAFAPPVRVGLSTSLAPTTVPPRRARVGEEWSFRPHIAGVHELVAMTLAQGIAANVEGLTWTPTAADAGSSIEVGLAVRRPGKPLLLVDVFQVEVVGADQSVAPAIGGATRVDGVVGQALAAPIDVPSDAEVTLVDAPSGMTWNAASREVRWTPSSNAAIASAGEVSFTVRATVPGVDAPSERTFLVHFADRDGDGLSDAYELASGLDAEAANASSADGDGDGLSDLIEDQRGLRGDAKDSDGDGLEDGAESTAGTDPRSVDTDGDGLVDGAEAAKGADPTKADSDGDGVSDGDEVAAGTDPAHAPADTDGDGLNDEAEARLGTDPAVADSDGDGCDDGVEVNVMKSNPGKADTDGDGADDCAERDAGTDPLVGGVDSDADGLSNDLEVVIGTAPSSADSDGDGWEDGIEVAFGSDPTLGDSKPPEDAPGANVAQMLRGSSTPLELTRAQVVDAGEIEVFPDADHDGAPDDYEELYGYDPANPADGASDDDGDGIPMWRESRYGTDPKKADSDGDGANDLDEIQAGTDPKDPGSKPSTGPITSIEVYPPKAGVVSNTIIGAGHLQLIVVGKRDDGSSADLTPATRGTTYSVDPVDAGAVSADGYFTAASTYEGPARVMVASGTLSGACDLVLSSFTPKLLASLPVPGANGRVAVAGPWVLVATSYGVALVDASVPGVPVVRGKLDLGAVSDVALRGTLGAAALGEGGVAWFDLGDPDHLLMLGKVPLEKPARALTLLDDRLVVATDAGFQLVRLADGGVGLLDVDGDGKDDRLLESLYPGTAFTTIDRDATYVVAGTTTGTLIVARITPGGLVPDRAISTGTTPIADAVVRGNVAAVALGTGGIARVSLAGAGAVVASDKTLNCQALDATGDLVVAANQVFTNPIALYSAQIPDQLPLVGAVQASGTLFSGLAVDRQYFYVVAPGVLQIGQHSVFSDLLGVPPRIVPQSPAPGAEFDEGAVVRFAVSASDDVAVDGVTLRLDDETLASFDQPPYAVTRQLDNVRVPTEVTVGATAFDPGQNIGTMTPYTITVRPVNDTTPPTGNFLLPIADELVASGHPFPVSINALDDYQVDAIELRVDGVLQKRLESPPWTTTIDAPTTTADPDGNVLVEATIIDFGENATKIAQNVIATGVDLVGDGVLTIGPGDTTYDGKDVLVDRGTVAISGAHSFHRFYVGPTGVVSQPPTLPSQPVSTTALTADLMVVVRGGAIDVSGQGFRGDCAAGDDSCGGGAHTVGNVGSGAGPRNGGAHGGDAGVSGNGARTAPYDDWVHPALPGSGGGYGCGGGEPGGSGGGVLAITATRLQVDGVIRADGARGGDTAGCPSVSGGGGGGALDLDIGTLTGSGPITADGGSGGAAGGGGRLALHYDDATGYALGLVRARPGLGAVAPGGAGTVYLTTAGKTPLIRIDDDGRSDGVDDRAFGATPDTARLDLAADLVITGESRLVAVQPLTAKDVTLVGRARISPLETTVTAESVLDLQCTNLRVGAFAALDAIGRGYLGDCSPGDNSCGNGANWLGNTAIGGSRSRSGGSHGGVGGGDSANAVYDDLWAPVALGSGGAYGSGGGEPGGDGGGRIVVTATASLTVDGAIDASGGAPLEQAQKNGAGGAGGTIVITTPTLGGAGAVRADGGRGASNAGNAGGGGRVALHYQALDGFDLTAATAYPGSITGGTPGGPGTVALIPGSGTRSLVIDDGGRSLGADDRALAWDASATRIDLGGDLVVLGTTRLVATTPLAARRVTLGGHAVLTHLQSDTTYEGGLDLAVTDLVVGPDAAIDVSGRGYLGDCSPGDSCGNGANWLGNTVIGGSRARSGGSYGGVGGGNEPNATYGDAWAPSDLGAGGAYGSGGGEPGGDGGGRVRVVASAGITLDGIVRADGAPGSEASQKNGAGGAGGAIWLTAPTLAGAGSVHADGGDGGSAAGQAGGGGRIALQYQTLQGLADGDVSALPGNGTGAPAGPGTVAWIPSSGTRRLVMDDGGRSAGVDDAALGWSASATPYDVGGDLTLRGTTRLVATSPLLVKALRLEGSAILSHLQTGTSAEAELEVAADSIDIAAGAAIDVDGRGYLGDCHGGGCGSGGYWLGNTQVDGARRSGGSHGGTGAGPTPNKTYGDPTAPTTLGAGGGYGSGGGEPGGDGGGRVHLLVGGALTLDGSIRAQGEAGVESSQRNGSGGAGGSVWIEAASLGGVGRVTVNGGGSASVGGYGGGGGRIALDVQALTLDAARVTAWPGHGVTESGGAGSVYLAVGGGRPSYVIDDGGVSAGTDDRPFGWDPSATAFDAGADLTVRGTTRLVLTSPLVVHDLTLADTAVLTHVKTSTSYVGYVSVTAATVTIGPDAAIDVSQRGFLGDCHGGACGSGGYTFGNVQSGAAHAGGSHGGIGGLGTQLVYDDPFGPVEPGQGGGYGAGGGEPGGDGGGRVRLVADRLVLDGAIRADGQVPPTSAQDNGSGGAGGSVWLTLGSLAGSGVISADGGNSGGNTASPLAAGGGGGRVAIEYEAIDAQAPFDLDGVTAFGGAAAEGRDGGAGTVWLLPAGAPGELRLDDGGRAALAEAAPWPEIGARAAVTVTAHEVTVAGTPWFADQLIGTELGVAGSALRFHVIGNGGGTLELDPADGDVTAVLAAGGKLYGWRAVGGNIVLQGSARVALADRVEARDLIVSDGAVLTHAVARSSIEPPGLWLALSGAATIAVDGAIDLIGRGIVGGCAPGSESCGGSSATLSGKLSGGSHGGQGAGALASAPFGDANAPFEVGGGGGYGSGGGQPGGNGGGRVYLAAASLALLGSIDASGVDPATGGGGGAGGAIWLVVGQLSGTGSVRADGAAGTGGGGGGGRVRLDLGTDAFTGPVSAGGGAVGGGAGTVVRD